MFGTAPLIIPLNPNIEIKSTEISGYAITVIITRFKMFINTGGDFIFFLTINL